jgi:methylmalonyl-CoA/ethylmalonyl-CoA epimerase
MLEKIDHIGIAVKSIEQVKTLYNDIFDIKPHFEEVVEDQKVKVIGIRVGESNLEFLEPTSTDSPIAKFLQKRGEGLHHVSIKVTNINEILLKMKSKGVKLIDEKPRIGAEGKLIAFIHPKSMNGILVELSQET